MWRFHPSRMGALAFCAPALLTGQASAPAVEEVEPMLLQPYLGKTPLADTINAFPLGRDGALVPLGELCRLLAFGIRVDAVRGLASGHFIAENRLFQLDVARGRAESNRRSLPFSPGQVRIHGHDLYVDARLLQDWFPLEARVDLRAAILLIKAQEKLPIQEEWERDRRYAGLGPQNPDTDEVKPGTLLPTPYAFLDVPFADLALQWTATQSSGTRPPQASAFVAGDLAWMNATAYAARDQDGRITNARATLSREDPNGGLLGPLHARRVAVGSLLQTSSLPLAGSLPQGRGWLIDNYPLAYRSKFAARTFRGLLQEGWSVEFFHNGALVAFQRSRPDGLYEFKDAPLRFGLNQFRLVFHGPLGQRREETTRIDIGSDQPPPGTFYYRVMGLRPDSQETAGMLPEERVRARALEGSAYLAEMDYGLSSVFAVNTSVSRVALADGNHDYTVAGLSGLFPYLSLQGSGAQDRNPGGLRGRAAEGILRTGLGYTSLTLRRSEYRNGFQKADQSNLLSSQRELRSESALDLSGTFDLGRTPIGILLSREQDTYAAGGWSTKDRLQVSLNYPTLNISQSFYRLADSTRTAPAPLESTLLVSSFRDALGYQGELSLRRLAGRTEFSGWALRADLRTGGGLLYRSALRGPNGNLRDTTFQAAVTKLSGSLAYGLDAQYSRPTGYTVGLRIQASFGREPRTGAWVRDAQAMAGLGAVSAVAYLDANGNGQRDPGERTPEGIQLKVRDSVAESRIQDPSVVFRTHLPRSQETLVQVDETSLEDPAQRSVMRGYRIVPRPGKVARLDFPVAFFGEITGTTRLRSGSSFAEYGGLEIQLSSADGLRSRRLRSSYDGFFEFRDLPLGDYILQVTPEEAARLRQTAPPPRQLHLDASQNLYEGQDLVMEAAPAGSAPAAKPLESGPRAAPPPAEPQPRPTPPPAPPPAVPIDRTAATAGPGSWTIVLVAASKDRTIELARQALGAQARDLFVVAAPWQEGRRTARRVCLGRFPSAAEARKSLASLPRHFFRKGHRPWVARILPEGH